VYELIFYLSGKRVTGGTVKPSQANSTQNKKDSLKSQITQYEDLLNFLKVHGAHLNTVRPEYLLSQ